jgi:hypothetical protein
LPAEKRLLALKEMDAAIRAYRRLKIESLIFDQLGNGGGDFIFGYTLMSRLTRKAMRAPLQSYLVDGEQVLGFGTVAEIERDLGEFAKVKSEASARRLLGRHPLFTGNLNYIDKNLTAVKNFRSFFEPLLVEAKANPVRHPTKPHFQFLEWVEPFRGPRFEGPIVMLIDEMNISAAEYVAALMKDNDRAFLIGATTAGAGGDQRAVVATASNGLSGIGLGGFTYTVTLGQRVSGDGVALGPIENRGIEPDLAYAISREDLLGGFLKFRELILKKR